MACRPDRRALLAAAALLALAPTAAAAPASDWLGEAARALERGDGIAAETVVRRALAEGVAREDVAAWAGEAELLQGDLVAARRWLGPGEFAPASRQRGFHALGRLELAEDDRAAAARAFDRALREGPGTARLWVDIGALRYRSGQHGLAFEAAAKALELDHTDPRALAFRGQLMRDSEGLPASLAWFEKALERAPDDLGLLGEYAATLGEAGRHRDMLAVARRMTAIDPRHPRAYFLQAVLAARAGHDDLARRLLWRTQGAYDREPAGRLLNGVLALHTGNAALAVDHFDALVRRQPDNALAAMLLGRALLAGGEAGEVIARLRPAADRSDAPPYMLALVGRAYELLGRRQDAARYLDRAAAAAPAVFAVMPAGAEDPSQAEDSAAAAVPRLRALLAQGRRAEANRYAGRLLDRFPDSADVARLAGDVALSAGSGEAARAHFLRSAAVRRDFPAVERLVLVERLRGRDAAAQALVRDYAARYPRSAPAAALYGRFLAQQGRWSEAAAWLRHARALAGADDPRLLADLSAALLMAGETEAAGEIARRAYALQRSNGRVVAVLARVMQASEPRAPETAAMLAKARGLARTETLALR